MLPETARLEYLKIVNDNHINIHLNDEK